MTTTTDTPDHPAVLAAVKEIGAERVWFYDQHEPYVVIVALSEAGYTHTFVETPPAAGWTFRRKAAASAAGLAVAATTIAAHLEGLIL